MRRAAILCALALIAGLVAYSLIDRRAVPPLPPGAPAGTALPGADGIVVARAAELDDMLTEAGFRVAEVRAGTATVPRLYVAAVPADMHAIARGPEKKRIFIKLMLPLILAANEGILADRARLLALAGAVRDGAQLAPDDASWLGELAAFYRVEEGDLDALFHRVDAIPASLALAQAALESGWGTSRFVREGNAAFGQRAWSEADGMAPAERPPGQGHVVKSFSGLHESVFSYLANLNRHPAYAHLRLLRAALREKGRRPDGWTLAAGLGGYAEESDYVSLIRAVIRQNGLADFDAARLADLAG